MIVVFCVLIWFNNFMIFYEFFGFKFLVGLLVIKIFGVFMIVCVMDICCCFLLESLFGKICILCFRLIKFKIFIMCFLIL